VFEQKLSWTTTYEAWRTWRSDICQNDLEWVELLVVSATCCFPSDALPLAPTALTPLKLHSPKKPSKKYAVAMRGRIKADAATQNNYDEDVKIKCGTKS